MLWNSAIVGAMVASGASLLSLVISKEAKISEFRQQWIDALREDLTIAITSAFEVEAELHSEDKNGFDAISRANLVSTRIELRLNQNEAESRELLAKLSHLKNALHDVELQASEGSFDEVQTRAKAAIDAGRHTLKAEWTRVKQGELTYIWTRRAVIVSFILFAGILIFDLVRPDLADRTLEVVRHFCGYRT